MKTKEPEQALPKCPYCGLETGIVEFDALYSSPSLGFAVVCPRCGARGPVHRQEFDFHDAEIAAIKLFSQRWNGKDENGG
jgi:DNA-directed RNA polymerase subunit RPC12/RpoP